jgi:metal-sulfur cluster biosynthetic enzyme
MTTTNTDQIEAIRDALRHVIDPELAINVVDLGMITEIECDGDTTLVSMVLTTMTCPFWELFIGMVKDALRDVPGVGTVVVRHDPRRYWSPDLLCEEARWELEIAGLLPTTSWLSAGETAR